MLEPLIIIASIAIVVLGPQIWAIRAWQGVWRWLAAAPLVLVGADVALILVSTAIDPTSHNLWPLELLFIAAIGLPVVGLLWLVRMVAKV
jgi:hypothetical protein